MRVVAMFRVSTERQANEGASLDAQQRIFREMAAKLGWTTCAEFRGCESATQAATERRVLQEVMDALRLHAPDALYVHEQSRLTRGDELEVALLLRELRERRVKIIVGGVVRDMASIDERFMVGIQSLVDRAESERIKERVNRGKRERALQGRKNCGPTAFGYRNPSQGDPKRGTLQIVPEHAAIVRRVFDWAAEGVSPAGIARRLNASAVPSPKGKSWGETSIRRILDNPAYIGEHISGGWVAIKGSKTFRFDARRPGAIVVRDAHEPIVSREVWDRVNGRPRSPRTLAPHMLTGLLWVNQSRCSGNVSKQRPYYADYLRTPGVPWLRVDATDAAVWNAFTKLAGSPELVEQLIVKTKDPESQEDLEAEIERHSVLLKRQQERSARLVDMRADGEIDKATYLTKSAEARAIAEQSEKAIRDLQARLPDTGEPVAQRVVRAIQLLVAGQTKLDGRQMRAILRSVVRRIDAKAVRTDWPRPRGERGRFLIGRQAHWGLQELRFHLYLPDDGQGSCSDTASVVRGCPNWKVNRPDLGRP